MRLSPLQSRVPEAPEFKWNVTEATTLGGEGAFTLSGKSKYGVVTTGAGGAGGAAGASAFAISAGSTGISIAPVRPEETSRTTKRILRVSAAGIKATCSGMPVDCQLRNTSAETVFVNALSFNLKIVFF